ncbi:MULTISPECIES: phage holin family protein [Janibacter]|uniref:Putative Holin-X, holin superfamily III n=1 Tax=Janibacter indicus TaxID=857417 RepID=A0A1W2DBB9_9MICO|nr:MULTISPECIES: phage holin family protein [Janibacter]QNF93755.1 phage holin family protein [Janibacter sp. YB324]SMC94386.1 Putative Holin-X, holin superfamily III [Janibacter indicus]
MSNDHARTGSTDPVTRRPVGQPAPGETERTVGQLVADASHDISALVQNEIQLAKAEVTKGLGFGGKGAGLLGGAAFLGLLGLIFLFHTLARVIAIWLPVWAGYLIITVVLLLLAAALGLLGYKALMKAKNNTVPQRAIRNAQETVAAIKPGS